MKTMRHCLALSGIASLLFVASALNAVALEAAPVVTVEVRGLGALAEDVSRVSMGLQRGPMGALMLRQVQGMLGLGDDFGGLDTNGTLRIFLYDDDAPMMSGGKAPVVLAVPTVDGGKGLIAAITNLFGRGTDGEGLTTFQMPSGEIAVGQAQSTLVFGQDAARVQGMTQAMLAGQIGGGSRIGVPGTIAFNFNMQAIRDLVEGGFDKIGSRTAALAAAQTNSDVDVGGILKAEGKFIGEVLGQVDAMQLGIDTEPGNLVFASRVVAKPETDVARIMQSVRAPRSDFAGVLPEDGAMFSFVGHLGDMDALAELYMDFAEQMFASMGTVGVELTPVLRRMMADWKGISTGDYAVSVSMGAEAPYLRQVGYIGIKDAAQAQAVVDAMLASLTGADVSEAARSAMQAAGEREHNGVKITRVRQAMPVQDALLADGGMPPGLMDQFTNMVYELAFVGDVAVFAMGGPGQMNASLDRLKAPGAPLLERPLLKSMFGGDPAAARATSLGSVSLVEYMKFVLTLMPGMDAQSLEMIPPSGSGLGGYTVTEGNAQIGVTKLGIAEIVSLKSMMPFFMMGAMGARGGMGGGGYDTGMEPQPGEWAPAGESEDGAQ